MTNRIDYLSPHDPRSVPRVANLDARETDGREEWKRKRAEAMANWTVCDGESVPPPPAPSLIERITDYWHSHSWPAIAMVAFGLLVACATVAAWIVL